MDDKKRDTIDHSPSNDETKPDRLNRRSYLASTAAAVSALSLASVGASASTDDYEVIRLDPGETITYHLDDGETVENLLVDQTARGARYQIKANDINSGTVRNVGWYGAATDRSGNSRHLLTAAANSGGEITFENIYMSGKLTPDDGDSEPSTCGGIRIAGRHAGTVYIRHTHVEGQGNNASYADSVGESGRGNGTVIYENCFHRNNTVSNYRIGTSTTEIRNSIGLYDDEDGQRGTYPYSNSRNGRNVWFWHQDGMTAKNSTFCTFPNDTQPDALFHGRWYSDSPSGDVVLYTEDCYINDDAPREERMDTDGESVSYDVRVEHSNLTRQPTATVLEDGGVPTSAEMAASGGREYVDPFDEGIENGAEPPEGDDEKSTEEDEPDEELNDDEHLLAFVTDPTTSGATYEFEADGSIEFTDAPYDSPSGQAIEGGTWRTRDFVEETDDGTWRAGGGTGSGFGDAYRVSGPITAINLDKPDGMWVELDGEVLSPEEIIEKTSDEADDDAEDEDESVDEDRLVAFITEQNTSGVTYEFEADGPIEFTEAPYDSPSGQAIEGGTWRTRDFVEETDDGTWRAGGGTGSGFGDAYRVTGPITSIDLDEPDSMWVELDGEVLSPEDVIEATAEDGDSDDSTGDDGSDDSTGDEPSNLLAIDGTRTADSVSYSFGVSGSLEPSAHGDATVNDEAEIDGSTVEAVIDDQTDAYWFSGTFTSFRLTGNADVSVDYDVR